MRAVTPETPTSMVACTSPPHTSTSVCMDSQPLLRQKDALPVVSTSTVPTTQRSVPSSAAVSAPNAVAGVPPVPGIDVR